MKSYADARTMEDSSLKTNLGIIKIGEIKSESCKTIVVVGHGRSGTSICSGVLHHMGVYTGDGSSSPVFEDTRLSAALESSNHKSAERIINDYNERHETWAYKRPSFLQHIRHYHHIFRNPTYIFIFRDPLAVAYRAYTAGDLDYRMTMSRVVSYYEQMLRFVDSEKPNGILVSFESIYKHKELFVQHLASIASQQSLPAKKLQQAIDFVSHSPAEYLSQVNASPFRGHLDKVSETEVSGWASNIDDPTPITIRLMMNGVVVDTIVADHPRPDVVASGLHTSVSCGFRWLPTTPIGERDVISAVFSSSGVHLNGSPSKAASEPSKG